MVDGTARDVSLGPTPPIPPDDHVHDDIPGGSCFGDDVWDYQAIRPSGYPSRYANFTRVPSGYRHDVKLFVLLQGRPHHPAAVLAGVAPRRVPASLASIIGTVDRLALLAEWGEEHSLATFSHWRQEEADALLENLARGGHRDDATPNAPTTIRGFVTLLQQVAAVAPLASYPLRFVPWPGRTGMDVAGEVRPSENATKPLPWATWQPPTPSSAFVAHESSTRTTLFERPPPDTN